MTYRIHHSHLASRMGALLGLAFALSACGGSDDGGSQADRQTTGGTDGGTDGEGDGSGAGAGSGEIVDGCSDPAPTTTCAAGWFCVESAWQCGAPGSDGGTSGSGTDLDGTACTAGQETVSDCSSCVCGADGLFVCSRLADCDPTLPGPEPNPNPNPKPTTEDYEGKPCTEGPFVEVECGSCFCTDAKVYMCAEIADCGDGGWYPEGPDTCDGAAKPTSACPHEYETWECMGSAKGTLTWECMPPRL